LVRKAARRFYKESYHPMLATLFLIWNITVQRDAFELNDNPGFD
jgi:hypothetical protein